LLNPTVEVTWVRFQKPVFDLVGLIVGSLELTGVFAIVAFTLGCTLGIGFILHKRSRPHRLPGDDVSVLSDTGHVIDS
jgi:hypothetical protein